jgi:glycosidase
MKGGRDPENRGCFTPDHGDPSILRFCRRLFAFRRKVDGLADYAFCPRFAEGGFYSFERKAPNGRLIVAANRGENRPINLAIAEGESLKDFFISGTVTYVAEGEFRISATSGLVAWVTATQKSVLQAKNDVI